MRYIPGFTFTPQTTPKQGGSLLQAKSLVHKDKEFKPNTQYTIQHIQRKENQLVEYSFIDRTANQVFKIYFHSFEEADNRLDKITGTIKEKILVD